MLQISNFVICRVAGDNILERWQISNISHYYFFRIYNQMSSEHLTKVSQKSLPSCLSCAPLSECWHPSSESPPLFRGGGAEKHGGGWKIYMSREGVSRHYIGSSVHNLSWHILEFWPLTWYNRCLEAANIIWSKLVEEINHIWWHNILEEVSRPLPPHKTWQSSQLWWRSDVCKHWRSWRSGNCATSSNIWRNVMQLKWNITLW